MNIKRILFGALAAVGIAAGAETADVAPVRPVNSSYMLSVGSSHLGDTYLSAVKYTGWSAAFNYDRMQAMKFSPDRWRQQLQLGVQVDGAENPARNAHMYYASLSASWGMMRRWELPWRLTVGVGGSAGGNFGATYCDRNSNNPASVKADITLNADLDFGNSRMRLGFRSNIYSTEVNHLTTRIFNYAFVVGVTGDWMSVSARRGLPAEAARIVYAY